MSFSFIKRILMSSPSPKIAVAASYISSMPGNDKPRRRAKASAKRAASMACAEDAAIFLPRSSRAACTIHRTVDSFLLLNSNSYQAGEFTPAI